MSMDMNNMMRRAGSRSRGTYVPPSAGTLPNIGQTPAVMAADLVMGQQSQAQPQGQPAPMPSPAPQPMPMPTSQPISSPTPMPISQPATASMPQTPGGAPSVTNPLAAPNIQPSTFTMHPPGTPADPNQYNYEPQPDGSWRVYPPGLSAPSHTVSASLPRAASTADYRKMHDAFSRFAQPSQPSPAPMP